MPPIISIVGKPKSGKTTLLAGLISELKSRGYRIATIKHSIHTLDFDKAGKDSWRHIEAGSGATAIVSPDQVVFIEKVSKQPQLNDVARLFGTAYDIILTEGFKQSRAPKVEVHRKAAGPPLNHVVNIIAVVTDELLQTAVKQFPINDISGLADLLEKSYIKPE
ncbi:MAG TPA: molybdopterin-guanine dinucleotide biosynthesis protein B [Dehalococcoidia bacterium]|jgi:molybdopterin-guanine dinucleotide biosynthesis protein B